MKLLMSFTNHSFKIANCFRNVNKREFNYCIKNVTRSDLSVGDHILIPQTGSKGEKTTIKPKNEQDKCFQYAATAALTHEEIKKDQQKHQKLNLL